MALRKGFVFTIDAILAVYLAFAVLITVAFLSVQAQDDPYGKVQLSRIARDSIMAMDARGELYGNGTEIALALNNTLPDEIGASLSLATYYYESGKFNLLNSTEYGEEVPQDKDTYGLQHEFVSMKNRHIANFTVARMTIWQR